MKIKICLFIFFATTNLFAADLTHFVDTRIGTAFTSGRFSGDSQEGRGNVQPSAAVPFGMVQWGPDTAKPDAGSYIYEDTNIKGFSLTHLSGPGCFSTGELSILPLVDEKVLKIKPIPFSHSDEKAQAGYYSVLLSNKILVELTSTERTGFGRFTFPTTGNTTLTISTRRTGTGLKRGKINLLDSKKISGWVNGGNFCSTKNKYKVFFAIELDTPIESHNKILGLLALRFNSKSVQMKVGISYVSEKNAWLNLQTENPGWDFKSTKSQAVSKWQSALSKIQVEGDKLEKEKRIFYTALYHSLLHPNIYSDVNGEYMGFDNKVHQTKNSTIQYANFSGWDIYRTQIQLLAAFYPERASEIAQSLINDAQQCGAFPRWSNNNTETGVMIGDPGSIIIANTYAFGARNFEVKEALEFMKKSGLNPETTCNGKHARPGLKEYLELGYVPYSPRILKLNDIKVTGPAFLQSASTTLEYASADFAVSQFAKSLGDKEAAKAFYAHANNWQNLFDPQTGYIRPKKYNKSWLSKFNPIKKRGFSEGNSVQYTWMIPFAPRELIGLMGQEKSVESRLDSFFEKLNAYDSQPHLWIGNEPAFSVPWLYHWMGTPHKTQKVISRILNEHFSDEAGGIPGNDDLGATSSWYVFAAMGIYPAIPGVGGFAINKPLFPQIEISLDFGRKIRIETSGNEDLVQNVTLNGSAYSKTWIPWSELEKGGNLHFKVGKGLSQWGTQATDMPPSYEDFKL
jgi:predicted alpha-1,2-mannosidase